MSLTVNTMLLGNRGHGRIFTECLIWKGKYPLLLKSILKMILFVTIFDFFRAHLRDG